MRTFSLLLVLLLSWPLYAKDVYKWTTDEGEVLYSDTYRPGSERVPVTGGKASPDQAGATSADGGQTSSNAAGGYESFEILSPENEETIRSNEGVVSVGLSLRPALTAGHGIQIIVDGTPLEGQFENTQFTLTNLNRGTHTLEAKILDGEGSPVISAPRINFHLRKASIIQP